MPETKLHLAPRYLLVVLLVGGMIASFSAPALAGVSPGTEVCDPDDVDEDLDFGADDLDPQGNAVGKTTWYPDEDGDGYGDSSDPGQLRCDPIGNQVSNADDLDDSNPNVYPGAPEVCDPDDVDEDADGFADDDDESADPASMTTWYPDVDGDGYGDAFDPGTLACDLPANHVADNSDSDDQNAEVNPGATEVCDPSDVDEDSDGGADDQDPQGNATGQVTWYEDADSDGYGNPENSLQACDPPVGFVDNGDDADDEDETVGPGATATTTTVNVSKTDDLVKAKGAVTPVPEGETIVVKFQRRVDGKWSLIDKKTPAITPTGYKATFSRPNKGGKFRFVARFAGNEEFDSSKATKEFNL